MKHIIVLAALALFLTGCSSIEAHWRPVIESEDEQAAEPEASESEEEDAASKSDPASTSYRDNHSRDVFARQLALTTELCQEMATIRG
ncbi:MAG: hypothetical protein LBS86_06945 [Treponema sp.]|jgi:PBP1b-binding outer membrane lipoprotein LpoB|nr:hypothetical protein [Treponema sp.]